MELAGQSNDGGPKARDGSALYGMGMRGAAAEPGEVGRLERGAPCRRLG